MHDDFGKASKKEDCKQLRERAIVKLCALQDLRGRSFFAASPAHGPPIWLDTVCQPLSSTARF